MLGAYVPWLVGLSREDARRFYPFMQKNVYDVLRESGYLHIQATKPDTAGNAPSLYPCEHGTNHSWYMKAKASQTGEAMSEFRYKTHVGNEFMGKRTV